MLILLLGKSRVSCKFLQGSNIETGKQLRPF
jgi:hypothetical protein